MLIECLVVGAGGAAGAICRYLLGLVRIGSDFPLMTFVTNLAGAVMIGVVTALAERWTSMTPEMMLFLKTGFCGGFTTFSTFSLETLTLLENHNFATAAGYIAASLVLCIAGVWIGQQAVERLM